MFPDCVYTSCRPFAAATGSFHLRTSFLVASSNLAIIQSPPEALPKYGKGCTIIPKCVSNVRGSPYETARTSRRSATCIAYRFHVTELDTCWHVGVLQGGDHVETFETSEYCSLHRRHAGSFAICIGVDAEWNSNRISQSQPGCEPGRPGEFFPGDYCFASPIFSKLLDIAEGLAYLHAEHTTHGDLKGVSACSQPPSSVSRTQELLLA